MSPVFKVNVGPGKAEAIQREAERHPEVRVKRAGSQAGVPEGQVRLRLSAEEGWRIGSVLWRAKER